MSVPVPVPVSHRRSQRCHCWGHHRIPSMYLGRVFAFCRNVINICCTVLLRRLKLTVGPLIGPPVEGVYLARLTTVTVSTQCSLCLCLVSCPCQNNSASSPGNLGKAHTLAESKLVMQADTAPIINMHDCTRAVPG